MCMELRLLWRVLGQLLADKEGLLFHHQAAINGAIWRRTWAPVMGRGWYFSVLAVPRRAHPPGLRGHGEVLSPHEQI